MSEKIFTITDIIKFFTRHCRLYIVTVSLFTVLAIFAVLLLPKKYKSEAIISIKASYFKNPLVSDLVSEVDESGEANAEREALIRAALNDDFIDEIGERYGIYKHKRGGTQRLIEREEFRNQIKFYTIGSSMYKFDVISDSRNRAHFINKAIVKRVLQVLNAERYKKLTLAKDAIEDHAKSLGLSLRNVGNPSASRNPVILKSELEKTRADIEALLTRYTRSHPEVVKLIKKSKSLEKTLSKVSKGEQAEKPLSPLTLLSSAAKGSLEKVYGDLITKLSYLSIILQVEKDSAKASHLSVVKKPSIPGMPLSPNPFLLLLVGVFSGFAVATVLSMYIELRLIEEENLQLMPAKLEMPLLGVLPKLESHKEVLYLEPPDGWSKAASNG